MAGATTPSPFESMPGSVRIVAVKGDGADHSFRENVGCERPIAGNLDILFLKLAFVLFATFMARIQLCTGGKVQL